MEFNRCFSADLLKIPKEKRFICFGAGNLLRKLCQETHITDRIAYLIDNNVDIWGSDFTVDDKTIPVFSPDILPANLNEEHVLLITTVYYRQVIEQINHVCPDKNFTAYYFPNERDILAEDYANAHQGEPLRDILVFRSGLTAYVEGFDFTDNAKALFNYLLKNKYNERYKLIWMVKYPERYEKYKKHENVEFVSYDWESSNDERLSDKYYEAMYFAKYFFFTDSHYWLRNYRSGQTRVNLWHGCGFKDRKKKSGSCEKMFEYMLVTSPMYAQIHAQEYGCDISQMLVTGLPKEDSLFNPVDKEILKRLDIKAADKYFFWLPTFRMSVDGLERLNEYEMKSPLGLPIVDTDEKMQMLDTMLEELKAFLVIKLHPVHRKTPSAMMKYRNIRVIENRELTDMDIHVNDLLNLADALISDYSSAAVDYLLLDRPIGFAVDDLDEYKNSRGFVFDDIKAYLPGEELYDFDDFVGFITNVSAGKDCGREKRQRLTKLMHQYNDNQNCRRLVEYLGL